MADAISIEETNKIRVAIGLKPLPVPGAPSSAGPVFKQSKDSDSDSDGSEEASTLDTRTAASYDNWKKVQDEAEAKKRRDARKEAIKKAQDAAKRIAKLEGKGLGDAGGDELDTRAWLMGQKKRQKKLEKERARKLEEELAERERQAEYTEKDLAGVKVAHEVGDFEDGEQVLVLKDTTIDENEEEGDELENVDLREREKLNERLELKKRRPVYDPNDDDGTGQKSILSHYDEEIDGKKRKRFTLDGTGATAEEREAKRQEMSTKLKATPISLDILKDEAPASDYLEPREVKIKKPKKNKAKSTRQRAVDEDDIFPTIEETNGGNGTSTGDVEMENGGNAPPKPKKFDTSFVDDDDLQASLALQRRAALKKRKKLRPEEVARQLREEASATPGEMDVDNEEDAEEPGLVIDETSEFVANLQRPTLPEKRKARSPSINNIRSPSEEVQEAGDVVTQQSYNDIEDEEDLKARITREISASHTPDITATGLDDEATLDNGIGATISMLRQRGLVKTAADGDLNALHRDRQRFLAEKQRREADGERRARLQRERDRASGKLDKMSARDREEHARWENKQRDQQDSRQMAEIFNKEYKPDVQLKYIDEYGRSMNQKEAFRSLSHQFHGKGSGKHKTEKLLKKIEDEKKREAMSALDSSQSTGMNNAMKQTAGKNRQAGVRLA